MNRTFGNSTHLFSEPEQEVVRNVAQNIHSAKNWTYYNQSITDHWIWCDTWGNPMHWLLHAANVCFLIPFVIPTSRRGLKYMLSILLIGLMLLTTLVWKIVSAQYIFFWNLAFLCISVFQLIYIVYLRRPLKFDPELEEVYYNLFRPFKIRTNNKGSHLDIRLPSVSSALATNRKSSIKKIAKKANMSSKSFTTLPESITDSEEKLLLKKCSSLTTIKASEMQSLPEMCSSDDDMASLNGVESLDSGSQYHSCELLEA